MIHHVSTRRAMLGGLLTAPAAVPRLAASAVLPADVELVAACDEALRTNAEVNRRAVAEDWSDDQLDAAGAAHSVLVVAAISMPAVSREGLAAKARLVGHEFRPDCPDFELYERDRLLLSLLHDLGVPNAWGRS